MNENYQPSAKVETFSLGLNQLIMFICVLFLGWKITELLALLGIELLVSGLLWYYVEWYWGLRLKPNRSSAEVRAFWLRGVFQIIALGIAIYTIYNSARVENSNLLTVEMGIFSLIFALMPFGVLAIWQQRGYIPTAELLPKQIRILLAYPQLFFTPILCGLGLLTIIYGVEAWQAAALICGLKLLFDLYIFKKSNV